MLKRTCVLVGDIPYSRLWDLGEVQVAGFLPIAGMNVRFIVKTLELTVLVIFYF